MYKKDSLYSINKKNPDAVVYKFANGEEHRITREDFPTEEAFLAFKTWSDENFHEEEKLDHREANHTLSTEDLSEAALATPAVDVVMERQHRQAEQRRMTSDVVVKLKDKLTDTAPLRTAQAQKVQRQLDKKHEEYEKLQKLLMSLYENLADGIIDREEYTRLSELYGSCR